MNILVTAGATREPIDSVRFISNVSTGRTGAALATGLRAAGHDVTLLRGEGAESERDPVGFGSAEDLLSRLTERLKWGGVHAVVMAAAVSDYRPAKIAEGKLSSRAGGLELSLVQTPKILPILKSLSPTPLTVVGFKLTVEADVEARRRAVSEQFAAGGVDLVVHNDLREIRRSGPHPFWLYPSPTAEPTQCLGAESLAEYLNGWLQKRTRANATG